MPARTPSRAVKLTGTDVPDGKRRVLTAGAMTATLDSGALRHIHYGGTEVLRGIAYLLRDKNWGTYTPAITHLKVRENADGFSVSYDASCKDAEQAMNYSATITANSNGKLVFTATATPQTDFLTNRSGFVVLHPLAGVVGQTVEVVHTDGKRAKRKFPSAISPGQPIFEIRSLKHQVMPGVSATVLMEGNKFEMEDHRNWMDASYKTYVCSLLDPWPYRLKKGENFTQTITLTIEGKPKATKRTSASSATTVTIGGGKGKMPAIGIGVPMAEARATLERADLVNAIKPAHLVCQIDGRNPRQAEAAAAFRELSEKTGAPVTLEIVLPAKTSAAEEVNAIASVVQTGGLKPSAVVVTQMHDLKSFQPNTPRPWGPTYEEMAAAARAAFPDATIGGGMLSYFTELNRKPTPKGVFDFVTHSVCPIVHAADDVSVMETLESLPSIFASARAIIGKSPYHLGPSSIACRDNPYGKAVAPNPDNGRVCLSNFDPRQRGLFAATWNLGLISRVAAAGLERAALGATTGPQGVIDGRSGKVVPAYHVLAGLAAASCEKLLGAVSSAPGKIAALAYKSKAGSVLWLANLTSEPQTVYIKGATGTAFLNVLDEGSFSSASGQPGFFSKNGKKVKLPSKLTVRPYAVLKITN
jgi:hypothetical protein